MWKTAAHRPRPEASPSSTPRQRQSKLRAGFSLGQPRPASANWQVWSDWPRPHRPCFPHRYRVVHREESESLGSFLTQVSYSKFT